MEDKIREHYQSLDYEGRVKWRIEAHEKMFPEYQEAEIRLILFKVCFDWILGLWDLSLTQEEHLEIELKRNRGRNETENHHQGEKC